jgi:hypothetical protein
LFVDASSQELQESPRGCTAAETRARRREASRRAYATSEREPSDGKPESDGQREE